MSYQIIDGIPVWGDPIANAVEQMRRCAKTATRCALTADHHLGFSQPVGGVTAYRNHISVSGIGPDQHCGNKAVRLNVKVGDIAPRIKLIMDDVWRSISFGVGRKSTAPVDHPLFDDPAWALAPLKDHKQLGRDSLGTVGSSNHFVDIFHDEDGWVWVGCHFGSRGIGFKTAAYYLQAAGGKEGMDAEPTLIQVDTDLGRDFLECLRLTGLFAYAGRDWVCSKVASIIGANEVETVHNHHNSAWLETHGGEQLWVIRKGATPCFPGQRGFVGATMGEQSVIIEGVDHEEARLAMYSTVHGAGRQMSRTEAAGKVRWKKGVKTRLSEGKVSRQMMDDWIAKAGVELRGGGVDEAPQCYKRLSDVLQAHANSVRIVHRLTPIGVAMAGDQDHDPFKD